MSPAITDVPGVLVGHAQDAEALTGCSVVLMPHGAVGGIDVRGGGPGTRETDLLNPVSTVAEMHAVALCGGSAFGLAAASGVVDWLYEQGIGYNVGISRVPIVPAAVIFDLRLGRADRWADTAMGYAAAAAATSSPPDEGCVGVGMGASVGKILGQQAAVKSGVGTWSERLVDGTIIGALVVTNAFGDVRRADGTILAGARDLERGGFADAMQLLRQAHIQSRFPPRAVSDTAVSNTTLAVVATNAKLDKAETTRLAQMAQDGLPRMIRPIHTPFDGDAVFGLSVGTHPAPHLTVLGSIAADVVAHAIERSVTEATAAGGLPAMRDL